MPQLIMLHEDDKFVGYAIRRWDIFNYVYLNNGIGLDEYWYGSWENKASFLFESEAAALQRWEFIMKKRKVKRKITVIKNL